jgi:enterochelin esterase-like enzyme
MIPKKSLIHLSVFLTFALLVACEPLAPDGTPQYIVVTGETPATSAAQTPDSAVAANMVGATSTSAVVNTPAPSGTPLPTETPVPTATSPSCEEDVGQVIQTSFPSMVSGEDFSYLMILPPCFYDTLQRYPYVILLHGTGYDETMWEQLGVVTNLEAGIAKGSLPPMVLVLPDGGYAFELNDEPENTSYESIILDELIPTIERDFCLWSGRQGRAIGGISRGGFWAFSIALRHPELFGSLGGHSPFFDPENAAPENNPLDLARQVNLDKFPLRIYMDNAANDYVSTNAISMSQILRENGIEHEYVINPTGDHDMEYWQAHVAEYLSFYGQPWPRDVSALPSCLEPSPE